MRHDGVRVGRVLALCVYPVKSTAGQALQAAAVTPRGLQHDRRWAVYTDDGGIASGKRTRRFRPVPGLMSLLSSIEDDIEVPELLSPDGVRFRVDDPAASEALTTAFDQRLTLRPEGGVQQGAAVSPSNAASRSTPVTRQPPKAPGPDGCEAPSSVRKRNPKRHTGNGGGRPAGDPRQDAVGASRPRERRGGEFTRP